MRFSRMVVAASVATLFAVSPLSAAEPQTASAPQATWYNQPGKLFGIAVPPEAKAEDPAPNTTVINSQKGYVLRIQTGPTSDRSLPEMAAKLESVYLGTSKIWTTKLSQEETSVGGLEAIATSYEGSNLRSKAVIARGAKTDFVLIFSAPSESYSFKIADFDWMLTNFRPSASEVVAAAEPAREAPKPAAVPAAPKAAAPLAAMPGEVSHFGGADLGYEVAFPDDWTASRLGPATVLLGGAEGTDAYYATVAIQNIQPPKAERPLDALETVLSALKAELATRAQDVRFADEGPMSYDKKGLSLKAFQFVVTYMDEGRRYKQWTLAVGRPDSTIVHVWSYRAPEKEFDIYRPIADAIRQSWRIEVASAN
jgi:hypothetical protein